MNVQNTCLILSFILQGVFLVDYTLFSKVEEFTDVRCQIAAPLEFGLQKKATRCAAMCSKSTTCKGFFYNILDKFCNGTKEVIADSDACLVTPGTSYYQNTEGTNEISTSTSMTPHSTSTTTTQAPAPTPTTTKTTTSDSIASSVYGNPCSLDSDCAMSGSICLDNVCSCIAGYRYQSSTSSCVTDCSNLGSTYIEYRLTILHGTAIDEYTSKSLGFCQDACTALSTCLGFNFRPPEVRCVLKAISPLTHPGDFSSHSELSYFSRNCD